MVLAYDNLSKKSLNRNIMTKERKRIEIRIETETADIKLIASLYETETAEKIAEILPVEGNVVVWGEEVYFPLDLDLDEEPDAKDAVDIGELGYWPPGKAFCIFFGPTPASKDTEPRAYSNVNVFGKINCGTDILRSVKQGALIEVINISR
jgi:hypothetical protein